MQISELLAHETLRLLLLTGEPVGEITGVVVTDLPKPGRYLNGGELVLTGMMWRHGPADSAVFVDYLVRAGVTALAAGDARLGHVPDDLVAACRERGLALLEVPIEVSFGAIIDVVDRVLLGEQRLALGRHRRIFTAVAEGAGLPELFAMARDELGVTGGVVSATGRVIAGEVPDASRMAAEFLRAVRLPHVTADPCTIFTVDRSHRVAGWALVLDGEVNPEIGYELASCVALERTRAEEGRRVERRLLEQLLGLAGSADLPELSALMRTCGLDVAAPYAIVAATALRSAASDGPDAATLGGLVLEEMLDRSVVAVAAADAGLALVPLRDSVGALAGLLKARLSSLAAPGIRLSLGLSAALTGPAAIRGGLEEAGYARRLADGRGGGLVTSDEIYTHALLLATVPDDIRRGFAARLLDPLFAYDRKHQADLVRTLSTFLDCAGSWNVCAERLHVHVNTVRYRIKRVEELTGRNLTAMADRVDLYLALRAS
ncbi:PucR family transcriptional regulator [Herbidospora cretacea]|uniref:PucR family transcriptional regulator n=1 Tax=Herbidospora cretacea TaxID=28444 RepID=UPI0007740B4F|nr:PucR family transcriptional regulator [Herbidospora cretacea]